MAKSQLVEYYLSVLQEDTEVHSESSLKSHLAIQLFGVIPWTIWRTIRSMYDKANKDCGTYSITDDREECISKARIKRSEKRLDALRDNRKKCDDKKDPKKCKKDVDDRIDYEKELIDKNKKRLSKLRNK